MRIGILAFPLIATILFDLGQWKEKLADAMNEVFDQ